MNGMYRIGTLTLLWALLAVCFFPDPAIVRTAPGSSLDTLSTKASKVILRGSAKDRQIALTFDDGPDPRFTPQILDVLKKHHVKGTFFLMGSKVAKYPDIVRRIKREGHVIGNHTYWHPNLVKLNPGRIRKEVLQTEKVLNEVIGFHPHLFRAPYGSLNEHVIAELEKLDYAVIGWSIDTLDWKSLTAKEIQKNVYDFLHPGAIILMHSGGHWTQDLSGTVEALKVIIPQLKKKGMQFVTVPQLTPR